MVVLVIIELPVNAKFWFVTLLAFRLVAPHCCLRNEKKNLLKLNNKNDVGDEAEADFVYARTLG